MIDVQFFYQALKEHGSDFFAGVPDSLLKAFCAYIKDNVAENSNITACNEGAAVALATGHYLATSNIGVVYMQNSGLGNAINPLLSLADKEVYSVPMLLLVGFRGMPGFHDEPQHKKQGQVTLALLDAMRIPYLIMEDTPEKVKAQLDYLYDIASTQSIPVALVIKAGTFAPYKLQTQELDADTMTREEAILQIVNDIGQDCVFVSTTGMASRELFEIREKLGDKKHANDFLTVGSMGHASQIALGIAMAKTSRKIAIIDGDGAVLMHLGSLTTIGVIKPRNLIHIVINNAAHDSVGGQPTVAKKIDLCSIAKAAGYPHTTFVNTTQQLSLAIKSAKDYNELCFIEVRVKKGARANLGRPTLSPQQNKIAFMENLQ